MSKFAAKSTTVGRKKKLPLLENVEITGVAAEGKALARFNNLVVFVTGLVPGDVADIQVTRKRKNYLEGFVVNLKKLSKMRIEPVCRHFGVCGGCKWQQLPYQRQLFYKQKQVQDNLERIAKVELPEIRQIIGSHDQYEYRNKLEYTFSATRWLDESEVVSGLSISERRALGFHIPGKFDRVLNIEKCHLQNDLSNRIRTSVRDYTMHHDYSYYHQRENSGLMRNLIIRNTTLGEWMVIVVFHREEMDLINNLMDHIRLNFPEVSSLMYVINAKLNDTIHDLQVHLFSGKDHLIEEMDGLLFRIGPKSFFQTNSKQALELYRIAKEFADLNGNEIVYDLYTGTGTIAIYLARHCARIIGIENVATAIEDAKINAGLNGLGNTLFFSGDIREVLTNSFIGANGHPEVIITDPPRAGMHEDVVFAIMRAMPERIIYVSCNPATQARDIQLLSEKYRVTKIQPVDMFPHTHHVENVVRLDLISNNYSEKVE